MASRDLVHSVDGAQAAQHGSTVALTAATVNGDAINTAGYDSLTFIMSAKPHTAGTLSCSFEDSADGSTGWAQIPNGDAAAIAKNYLTAQGQTATGLLAFTAAEVGVKKIGINLDNCKQYVRAVCVVGAGIAGSYSIAAVLGHPRHRYPAVPV